MAEKRMFSKTIIDSDSFLDMSHDTQLLYFHLAMRADDDGFVNNAKRILRTIGCNDDDLKMLFAKQFVIPFESGVVVIKHWKIHNYIQKDRYKETLYQYEKSMLTEGADKSYELGYEMDTNCIQVGHKTDTQIRLDKNSIDKISTDKNSKRFTPPTQDEVKQYCEERNNNIDAEAFFDYYTSQGWVLSNGQKMKDWKSAVRNWERRDKGNKKEEYDDSRFGGIL